MRKQTVTQKSEIKHNILKLEEYRDSPKPALREYYASKIARGSCFVMYRKNGKLLFGPSRFIGYIKNTKVKHDKNHGSGTTTNVAIKKVLNQQFAINPKAEREFLKFCAALGIEPKNNKRKFIAMESPLTEAEELLYEIDEIKVRVTDKTEKEQQVLARLGQGSYREALLKMWKGKCSITGCAQKKLLRASHIKPWRACDNSERLDKHNGLLLIPNLDAAFDRGLITFSRTGKIKISKQLDRNTRQKLGINAKMAVELKPEHEKYMAYHRENIYEG